MTAYHPQCCQTKAFPFINQFRYIDDDRNSGRKERALKSPHRVRVNNKIGIRMNDGISKITSEMGLMPLIFGAKHVAKIKRSVFEHVSVRSFVRSLTYFMGTYAVFTQDFFFPHKCRFGLLSNTFVSFSSNWHFDFYSRVVLMLDFVCMLCCVFVIQFIFPLSHHCDIESAWCEVRASGLSIKRAES